MPVPTDITAGTISITGTTVTGVGTSFLASDIRQGDLFVWVETGAGRQQPIVQTVNSNTSITLAEPWTGADVPAGSRYRLRYQWDSSRVSAQARQLIDLLDGGNLSSIAGLDGTGGDKGVMFNGPGSATTFALTAKGRAIVSKTTNSDVRDEIGAGVPFATLVRIFDANATYTPTAGLTFALVECIGGGGAGGGVGGGAAKTLGGGGGGSGAYTRRTLSSSEIGVSQPITIGAGGVSGGAGANGGNGGTTSFGTLVTAPGGNGGTANDNATAFGTPGSGGAGGTGNLPAPGSPGSTGSSGTLELLIAVGGQGGNGFFGGGATETITGFAATAGAAGRFYGGGGAGAAVRASSGTAAGGAGYGGIVIVTEYF